MLSPSQQAAYEYLLYLIPSHRVTGLVCPRGCGLSTVLEKIAQEKNAHLVRLADFYDQIENLHPFQLEEGIAKVLLQVLQKHDCVVVDDFSRVTGMIQSCRMAARPNIMSLGLDAVWRLVEKEDKRLILGLTSNSVPAPFYKTALLAKIPAFSEEDFAHFFQKISEKELANIDFGQVHRFASKLTVLQMKKACKHLKDADCENTDAFLKFLEERALISNVNTAEVEQVSFDSLYGAEDVIRQLEINIITPLAESKQVRELGLKPKRGVLLYGPPGTGKTTIGRALAHRLKSKFFLIDGTIISGTPDFYKSIRRTINAAKQNAPSILFIDDCDLLFENEETGLYRFLLTMLDGLESKSNSEVTIMLTAMNIGSLPPALIRSGRIELWLEMKLPTPEARAAIMKTHLADFPLSLSDQEITALAEQTDKLTGADLRRIVTDAKNLYGYDVIQKNDLKDLFHYFEEAIKLLRKHRKQLESAPAFTAAHRGKVRRARLGV